MRLFTQIVAPNPTKVELYLAEKEAAGCVIPLERTMVNLTSGEQREAGFSEKNPLQRVPLLELDDGMTVPESLAIIEYFEELFPAPSMIGETPAERARVRALERSIDTDLMQGVIITVHSTNSPVGYPKNPGAVTWFENWMKTPLEVLDGLLSDGRAFVAGAQPTIADCTLAATLQFARLGQLDLVKDYKHIQAWDEMYRSRPHVKPILIL